MHGRVGCMRCHLILLSLYSRRGLDQRILIGKHVWQLLVGPSLPLYAALLLLLLCVLLYVCGDLCTLIHNGGRHDVLGAIENQHFLLISLLKLIIVLLRGRWIVSQLTLSPSRAFIPRSRLMMKLVVELRLQEGLLVLIAKIRVGHVQGRGLWGVVPRRVHLPRDLRPLEVYQRLLKGCHDVLT